MWSKALYAFCASLGLLSAVQEGADFPQAEIANGLIRTKIYLPDAKKGYYRATRFDWSGVIARLEYKGHTYFGVWNPRYEPRNHDSITGPVEEFRTGESGLGYEEARPGGTFIRIGVGVLRKPEEARFSHYKTYDIVDPGSWSVRTAPDSVEFTHELGDPASGYRYLYRKTVRLVKGEPQMRIEHSLKNTGRRVIETNVYNHDFFVIDSQPSGPDFVVRFQFEPRAKNDLRGLIEIRGKELGYIRELQARESAYTELGGFTDPLKQFDIRVENRKVGAGVRIRGDRPLSRLIFWSMRSVVCPEVYIDRKIEPGRESTWRLTYDFYTLPAGAGH